MLDLYPSVCTESKAIRNISQWCYCRYAQGSDECCSAKKQLRGKFLLPQSLQMLIHRPSDKLHVAGLSLWDVLGSHLASL